MSSVPTPRVISSASTLTYFSRMQIDDLDTVLLIENEIYPHPWTRGNFLDSLSSGYETWTLHDESGMLIGYFLVMLIVDEAHLLNVSVRADLQGKGFGKKLLDKVVAIAEESGMNSVLLEVRPSNKHALDVYKRYGFTQIGLRKGYYPDADNTREDAIVMRLPL
jgi:ribosomal-protein-alanine N-acetyltransferase